MTLFCPHWCPWAWRVETSFQAQKYHHLYQSLLAIQAWFQWHISVHRSIEPSFGWPGSTSTHLYVVWLQPKTFAGFLQLTSHISFGTPSPGPTLRQVKLLLRSHE